MTSLTPPAITERELALARQLAAKFASMNGTAHLQDEWESAAMLGLAEAAGNYDPDRGTSFRTHAFRRIWGAILDASRSQMPAGFRRSWLRRARAVDPDARPPETRSLDWSYESQDGDWRGPVKLANLLVDEASVDDPVGWEIEYHDDVEEMSHHLPITIGPKFHAFHTSASSMRVVGERLGCSESRVSQCVTQAHRYLSENLGAEEAAMNESLNGHTEPEYPDDPAEIASRTAVLRDLKVPRREKALNEGIPPGQLDAVLPAVRGPKPKNFERPCPPAGSWYCTKCGRAFRPPAGATEVAFSQCLACRRAPKAAPPPAPPPAPAPEPTPEPAETLCSECGHPFDAPGPRQGYRTITRCERCRERHPTGPHSGVRPPVDPELAAMAAVLALGDDAARRVIAYVSIRLDSGGAS